MNLIERWKTLPAEVKDYLFVYVWGILWFVAYLAFSPASTFLLLDRPIIALWCIAATVGAVIAIMGLFRRDYLLLERMGVTIMMVGPILYAVTQTFLIIFYTVNPELSASSPLDRVHLIFLGLWPLVFLIKRLRVLSRRVGVVATTPLEREEKDIIGPVGDKRA